MIREQTLSGTSHEENPFIDPTAGELLLVVDGDTAVLDWRELGLADNQSCVFQVPARSLLLALQAAYDDVRSRGANAKVSQDRDDGWRDPLFEPKMFPHRGEPWTAELDKQLREDWLSTSYGVDPPRPWHKRLDDVAEEMGRDKKAVAARLRRLGCDPDVPGGLLDGAEPAAVASRAPGAENEGQ